MITNKCKFGRWRYTRLTVMHFLLLRLIAGLTTYVLGIKGERGELPCGKLTTTELQKSVFLVLWFREGAEVPFYTWVLNESSHVFYTRLLYFLWRVSRIWRNQYWNPFNFFEVQLNDTLIACGIVSWITRRLECVKSFEKNHRNRDAFSF
jgi:hypothetical protein